MSRESLERTLKIRTFENKWLHQSQKIHLFPMRGNEVLQTNNPWTEVFISALAPRL